MLNAPVKLLLRSPLHGLASGGLALLTVTGRRSGRSFTFPVQYARDGDTIVLIPGRPDTKTWWRNLVEPARVGLRLRGRDMRGTAVATRDPEAVADGLATYLARFPRASKAFGVDAPASGEQLDRGSLLGAAQHNVVVRVTLD